MKQLRHWIPFLGMLALAVLFLSLPETPNVFGILKCKTCASSSPYLPLIGSGYFASLIAISLLFPAFPNSQIARGGLTWAVLLAFVLTYLKLPHWCIACLIGHLCNIVIWTIWLLVPLKENKSSPSTFRERLCLTLFAPFSVVALFSCLNLTFMAYGFKTKTHAMASSLQPGDALPAFTIQTTNGHSITNTVAAENIGTFINFVSPACPYCQEQLPIFNTVAKQMASSSYRFINVSPTLSEELIQSSPGTEWVEDRGGQLHKLFKVAGYPTMFIVGKDGKIAQVIPGVPEKLKAYLFDSLDKVEES
jgi:peroxiredoxin